MYPLKINNTIMSSSPVPLKSFIESGIPQSESFNVSQQLNGDLPGTYAIDLNLQLEVVWGSIDETYYRDIINMIIIYISIIFP